MTDFYDMTDLCMWHDWFMRVTWLIHMRDLTHSCVWHDGFMCATRLIHDWDMSCMKETRPWYFIRRITRRWRKPKIKTDRMKIHKPVASPSIRKCPVVRDKMSTKNSTNLPKLNYLRQRLPAWKFTSLLLAHPFESVLRSVTKRRKKKDL